MSVSTLSTFYETRFALSLAIAAVVSSTLEERDVSNVLIANIDLTNSDYRDVTPPTSFRVFCTILISCLSTPHIFKTKPRTQFTVLVVMLSLAVILGIHSSNRLTRSSQAIFVGLLLWLVGSSMLANVDAQINSASNTRDMSHSQRLLKGIIIYVSLVCIKGTFEVCATQPDDPVSAGCKSCDVLLNVLICLIASSALSEAIISYTHDRNDERHTWIAFTATGIGVVCYCTSILLVGRLIAHNPAYLPAQQTCKDAPLQCDLNLHDFNEHLLERRNTIVAYSPGSVGLIILLQFVNSFLHARQSTARHVQIVTISCAVLVVIIYFGLLIFHTVHANVSYTYQGNEAEVDTFTNLIPWLTDLSVLVYGIGVIVATCGLPRIGVLLMQLAISLELIRAFIEYGTVRFIQFFTMDVNVLLVVLACAAVATATSTRWCEWILLVARALALLLTLAYICAFSIVDGLRSEQFVNIYFDDSNSYVYEHNRIILLGIRAGARAIILHFAQLPAFMILIIAFVRDDTWKWAIDRQRTVSWFVWLGSTAVILAVYALITQVFLGGVPSSYPLSDTLTVGVGTVFLVGLPFVCAL